MSSIDPFDPFEAADEDDDLEMALLTSSREAFTGFSNLVAILPVPDQHQRPFPG